MHLTPGVVHHFLKAVAVCPSIIPYGPRLGPGWDPVGPSWAPWQFGPSRAQLERIWECRFGGIPRFLFEKSGGQ